LVIFCTLQFDFPRLNQVLQALDGFTGKWAKKNWWNELQLRINYGVKGPMLNLCQLPNIGKARATKLWNAGIRSLLDVVVDPARVRKLTGLKADKVDEIILEAKVLLSSTP
jgi:replicative superfamily II helicase